MPPVSPLDCEHRLDDVPPPHQMRGESLSGRTVFDGMGIEERFRLLTEALDGLIYDRDLRANMTVRSQGLFSVLGFRPEDAPADSDWWFSRVHPEDLSRVRSRIESALGHGRGYDLEYRMLHHDGRYVHVWDKGRIVRDEQGRPVRVVGGTFDITGRKRAEEQQVQLATIVESSEDAIIGQTLDGLITSWNAGAERLYGWSGDEAMGRGLAIIMPPERSGEAQWILESVRQGRQVVQVETVRLRKDGLRLHVSLTVSPIRDAGGRVIGAAAIERDMTERKRTEQQLRELNEKLEQSIAERTAVAEQRADQLRVLASELTQAEQRERRRLARILHDHLQQLLIAARIQLGMVREDAAEGQHAEALNNIDHTLTECIQASRSLTVELSPPILHDRGLTAALHWLGRRMRETHGLSVEAEADETAEPTAEAVRILLFEIVRELLLNVVKHAQVGQARVTLSRFGRDQVQIVVSDDGAGFDVHKLMGDDSSIGFGLSSVRQRLELLGGHLELDSALGRGTRVALLAPLHQPDQVRRMESSVVIHPAPDNATVSFQESGEITALSGGIRVLLADDHKIVREGLMGLLQREADIEVVGEASDGQMAVELAHSLRPDVIIMDINMPRLNGIEATARVTAELPGIQVIGLSLHDEEDMAHAMFDAGASAYLAKGGPSGDLIAAIRAARPS